MVGSTYWTWIEFTYSEVGFHRYFPKISAMVGFSDVDSTSFRGGSFNWKKDRRKAYLQVDISSDTLWISAQRFVETNDVAGWKEEIFSNSHL